MFWLITSNGYTYHGPLPLIEWMMVNDGKRWLPVDANMFGR